jgi:hypothetical protein
MNSNESEKLKKSLIKVKNLLSSSIDQVKINYVIIELLLEHDFF